MVRRGHQSSIARLRRSLTARITTVEAELATVRAGIATARAKALDDAFLDLCPPADMLDFSEILYRGYVQELLDQVGRGLPRTATNAEVVKVLSYVSNKTPISGDFSAAYWIAMCELFGKKKMKMLGLIDDESHDVYTPAQLKEGRERLDGIKNDINRRIIQKRKKQ